MHEGTAPKASGSGGIAGWAMPLASAIVALACRLAFISGKSIWVDEAYAAGLVGEPILRTAILAGSGTPHPPLAFLLLKLSVFLFGPGEAGARMLFAFAGAAATVFLFRFCLRFGSRGGAFLSAMIWAVCPMAVSLGQEAWIYGPLALWSFAALDASSSAWRGSRKGLAAFIAVSAAGFSTQHAYLLAAVSCLALYFTVPAEERAPVSYLLTACAAVLVMYAPLAALFGRQLELRARRMAAAGMQQGIPHRMMVRAPSVFTQFLAGGVFPDLSRAVLTRPRMLTAVVAATAVQLALLLQPILSRRLDPGRRLWIAATFLAPFGFFLFDDPTVRQFTIGWAAFGAATAAAASTRPGRAVAFAALALSAALLVPYYSISSFPYHRSDWQAAEAFVQAGWREGDALVVLGSKSAGQAWRFYAGDSMQPVLPDGSDPYRREDAPSGRLDPFTVVDSLLSCSPRVWLVQDHWAGPSVREIAGEARVTGSSVFGDCLAVMLLDGDRD